MNKKQDSRALSCNTVLPQDALFVFVGKIKQSKNMETQLLSPNTFRKEPDATQASGQAKHLTIVAPYFLTKLCEGEEC
eukprot:1156038-Pelagomonas_calceolata.AAC.5